MRQRGNAKVCLEWNLSGQNVDVVRERRSRERDWNVWKRCKNGKAPETDRLAEIDSVETRMGKKTIELTMSARVTGRES